MTHTMSELKIFIQEPFLSGTDQIKIFILRVENGKRYHIGFNPVDGHMQATLLNDNEPSELQPFMQLSVTFFQELTKAMVDYASDKGIKTENENHLMGKMAATEKHLEDMRRLIFDGKVSDKSEGE